MFDIHISDAQTVTISPAPGRRYAPPHITITNQRFLQGYTNGFTSALTDQLTKDAPLDDETIIDIIRLLYEDGAPTNEDLEYAVGNLIGTVFAKG